MMTYIESKFPQPRLLIVNGARVYDDVKPWVVRLVELQHKSLTWHLEKMVMWAEGLRTRGGLRMKEFGIGYGRVLEVMVEHNPMEERVVFPLLEMADRGICKTANDAHAKQLPIMNGIKEAIKSLVVLDSATHAYQEALSNIFSRLKSLQGHCNKLFAAEESDVLPLMGAVELSKEQEHRAAEQCLEVMQGTHSSLLSFMLDGLLPHEAMQYLD